MRNDNLRILAGSAHPKLAGSIGEHLGLRPSPMLLTRFSDGEVRVKIEESMRGMDVFVIQPTTKPVNEHVMELLIILDALRRASVDRITVVMPYYGYARQDKKVKPREPITARLIADLITLAGAHRVLAIDLHAEQIQGFFNIPVDELTAVHILSNYFKHKRLDNLVVVTDLGFAKRARTFAELLDAPLAIIEKRRIGNLDRAELMNVIGDVRGKRAVIVDDEIDTAGTLTEIVRALQREEVSEIYACATHGVLSGPAVDLIRDSPLIEVVLTDSIPLPAQKRLPKITTLSVAPLIGEAIKRIHRGESVGALFSSEVAFTQEMLLWEDGVARKLDLRPNTELTANGSSAAERAEAEATTAERVAAAVNPGDR